MSKNDNIDKTESNSKLDTFYKVLKIIFFPITLLLWLIDIIFSIFN